MKQSHKILIGTLVIVAAVGYLIISGFKGNTGYQKTITELVTGNQDLKGQYLLVEGTLVPSSDQWDGEKIELRFEVTDGQNTMPVVYNGVKPDNFDYPDAQLILEGYYEDGIFKAESVVTRCPSKYESAEEGETK